MAMLNHHRAMGIPATSGTCDGTTADAGSDVTGAPVSWEGSLTTSSTKTTTGG